MGRKFWIGWMLSYVGFAVAYVAIWLLNPPLPRASSGLDPARIGIGAVIMLLPITLGTIRISKLHPSSVGKYVLPALLALLLLVVSLGQGLMPDDPAACGTIASFGDPLPPECFTPPLARARALGEATIVWLVFGALALIVAGWRRRYPAKPDRS